LIIFFGLQFSFFLSLFCIFFAVCAFFDSLYRAVEKDADFVISSSSAYKGTPELEMAKSVKTSDFSEVFLYCF